MPTDPRTVEVYDQYAQAYDTHVSDPANSFLHEYYEKPAMRAELSNIKNKSALSLGCGSGADAAWLLDNGAKPVVGVDISKELIKIAQKNYPGVKFVVMDMEKLDFPSGSFDLVYSSLAIHYASDWNKLFKEIKRVLKPGGTAILSCNHPIETAMKAFANKNSYGVHIGRTIDKVTKKREIYGDYLAAKNKGVRPRSSTIADEHTVYSYHRTFANMTNSIVSSGFKIKKLVEPVPLPELKKISLEHYNQVIKTPKFIIWVIQS